MRLFYFANLRLPTEKAHGVQIMKMCEAFQVAMNHEAGIMSHGNDVTLIVPFRWRTKALRGVHDVFTYYGVRERFSIVRIPSLDTFPLLGFFWLGNRIAFALQYGTFLLSVICYLLFVIRRADVIYTRDVRLARLALRFTPNVFFELHTIPQADDIATASRARDTVTVTEKLKEFLVSGGVSAEKILVAPDAVDLAAFDAITDSAPVLRKSLGFSEKERLIGYAGRLTTMGEEKGVPELLGALALVRKSFPNAKLCILGGDAGEEKRYAGVCRKLGVTEAVRFIPRVPPPEVPKYLKAFDVLVAPFPDTPHYRFAMSPLKIFEYMAAERPMVVPDLRSLREVLSEREAEFFASGDAASLAAALQRVLQNPVKAGTVAKNARGGAWQFSWKNRAEKILDFIQRSV